MRFSGRSRPRPDVTVGFSSSAFTCTELQKLVYYRAPQNATEFVKNLYFPFLTCEVKVRFSRHHIFSKHNIYIQCGDTGLNRADRQNIRNASTAVNAILQLYRVGHDGSSHPDHESASSQVHQLHRKIIVFSISHDHTTVKIYGHYALMIGDKTTFHRHLINSFDLTVYDGQHRWTAYNFVRNLYADFAPTHLQRIRDAVARLPEPPTEPRVSVVDNGTETESEVQTSQVSAGAAAASRDSEGFVRPALPPRKRRMNKDKDAEIALLQQQKEESDRRHGELMELLKEQKEQNGRLMDLLSRG